MGSCHNGVRPAFLTLLRCQVFEYAIHILFDISGNPAVGKPGNPGAAAGVHALGNPVSGSQSAVSVGRPDAHGCLGRVCNSCLYRIQLPARPDRGRAGCVYIQRPDGRVAAFFAPPHRVLGGRGHQRPGLPGRGTAVCCPRWRQFPHHPHPQILIPPPPIPNT